MKRCLVAVAVALMGGSIVNVAVAWTLALVRNLGQITNSIRWGYSTNASERWYVGVVDCPPGTRFIIGLTHALDAGGGILREELPTWSATRDAPQSSPSLDSKSAIYEIAHGWPFVSLRCTLTRSTGESRVTGSLDLSWGIALGQPKRTSDPPTQELRVLPLLPIWPGFVANSLVYGALLWLLFVSRLGLRWLVRVSRGRCANCGYRLGKSVICPECGAQSRPRRHSIHAA